MRRVGSDRGRAGAASPSPRPPAARSMEPRRARHVGVVMSGAVAFLISPFLEFSFMRRALVAILALAMGCGPVGTLLILRRMSLMGDALSHAVLPGAAIGFLV